MGGAERVAALLAEAQAAAGHNVFAASLTRDPQPAGNRAGVITRPLRSRNPLWIEESSRYPAPVRLANKAATIANIVTARQFGALLDEIQPDVLHTHSMVELPPMVWSIAARRGIAIVHTLHDYDLLCIRGALFKDGKACAPRHLACRVLSAPKRALHDHIDVVAAVSAPVLAIHRAHGLFEAMPPEARQVVWNPVEVAGQAKHAPPRDAGPDHVFGFMGRLVSEKGLGILIDACRRLPPTGWRLVVAGAGPDRERFEQQAIGMPVEFLGFADARVFLGSIDTLVVPPMWDEPFGLTTLEAYAAGKRVIGSDSGVIREFIDRVDPGWCVPKGDVPALAERMQAAMQAGTRVVLQHASALLAELAPERVANRYLHLYQQARRIRADR